MADKAISELISAEQITPTDMFVLEQNGTAKKLTGQVLLNWLTAAADGHGGIQDITGPDVSGLEKTYTIILADQTQRTFTVTDGNGVADFKKIKSEGLVDTYRMTYDDGTYYDMMVANGAKGDKGDNAYVYFKWASQDPSISPHSMGDIPDDWQGVYTGNLPNAPTDWQAYIWVKVKGEKGDTGEAASLLSKEIVYQASASGTIYPSGAWSQTIPVVPAGSYLWTRVTLVFNSGDPVVSYSVGRMGMDGSGTVSTVCNKSPDANGNVELSTSDVGAVPASGGDFTGAVNMNGQPIYGLNAPTQDSHAANKGYVDERENAAKEYADSKTFGITVVLTSGGWSDNTQTVNAAGVTEDNDIIVSPAPESFMMYGENVVRCTAQAEDSLTFTCDSVPQENVAVNVLIHR